MPPDHTNADGATDGATDVPPDGTDADGATDGAADGTADGASDVMSVVDGLSHADLVALIKKKVESGASVAVLADLINTAPTAPSPAATTSAPPKAKKKRAREVPCKAPKTAGSRKQRRKKKIDGQPKGTSSAYIFYQNAVRPVVKEENPGLNGTGIIKLIATQWGALSDVEKKPYQDMADGDKVRYEREMVEWREKLGPEKLKEMEDAALAESVEKKRKRAVEKVERDAVKAVTIAAKSKERFRNMRDRVTTDPSMLFKATEGKPAVAPAEDMTPYYSMAEYVSVAADTSPGKNRPWGHGYVVAARGTGTGTIVDVAYEMVYDEGPTRLPTKDHPLQALIGSLGRVHRGIPFDAVTRVPFATPNQVPSVVAGGSARVGKRQRAAPKQFVFETPSAKPKAAEVDRRSPAERLIDRLRDGIHRKKGRGWRREELNLGDEGKKQMSTREKNALLQEYYLLKGHAAFSPQARAKSGRFAKRKGVKNPDSVEYLMEAWGMSERYISELKRQLKKSIVGSDLDKEIMDTMLQFPKEGEPGEKKHVSCIDSLEETEKFYTAARIYAIHTLRPQTAKGGKTEETYEEGEKGASYSSRISELMASYDSLSHDDKLFWEAKHREHLARQPVIRQEIIDAMRKDPKRSWDSLEADIDYWCSADTIRRWVESREGYCLYAERIIPLLSQEQMAKHFDFAAHFRNNWGLGPGKYLLIHYDEKWFWGLVQRRHAKSCKELDLDPVSFAAYHRLHINKTMGVAVTGFAFEDSIENGGDALKLGFFRAQQYKIADRAVNRTEVGANGEETVTNVRVRDQEYFVDCCVTGSDTGMPDDPKFPLRDLFEDYIFPIVENLVSPGEVDGEGNVVKPPGKYAGYTPVIQGDNAGPHQDAAYLAYVRGYCASRGWHWEPQAPQMPHMNVLDLSVFPCMSRRHSALARQRKGLKVLSENQIWETAEEVWEGLQSSKIASGYIQAHRIAKRVMEENGSNSFLGVGGTPHVGIRKDFYPTEKGLARRDGMRIAAP